MTSQFTVTSKLIDVQFSSNWSLSEIDEVVPDWIKIQSSVSIQVRFFLSDVDDLKDFSSEVLGLLLKNLEVIPVYLVGVFAPFHMFINCRNGSCCSRFLFRQLYNYIIF